MFEAETGRSADSVKGTHSSGNFSEIFEDNTSNSIFLKGRNTDSEKIMQLLGSVTISDSQQGSEVDASFPEDAAYDAAQHTIQETKDAAKLDGASSDAALSISREIKGLSTLPEQYFDFDQFYVGVEMRLTLNGDRAPAVASLAELDKAHVIRDELDQEYLAKHGSSNSDVIHSSVDNIVNQVIALSQEPMCLTDSALAPIYEAAKKEMSTLTAVASSDDTTVAAGTAVASAITTISKQIGLALSRLALENATSLPIFRAMPYSLQTATII